MDVLVQLQWGMFRIVLVSALILGIAGCQPSRQSPSAKTSTTPTDVVTPEKSKIHQGPLVSRSGDWIDADRMYLLGNGVLRIDLKEGSQGNDTFYRRVSSDSLDLVRVHDNLEAMGEVNGSEEIRTYLYSYGRLIAVIPGQDQSDFQFTRDGKQLVVVSYDQLDVVDCETGKIVRSRRFGTRGLDATQSWLKLPPGGEGRYARVFTRSYSEGEVATTRWWDPIADRPIADPIKTSPEHFVWCSDGKFMASERGYGHGNYVVYRSDDKRRYIVEDANSGEKLGEIEAPPGKTMSFYFSFHGEHGLYAGGILYDLRTRKAIATITAEVDELNYLISDHDGYFFGNMDPKKHGLDETKRDPERVRRTLIDGLGLTEPEPLTP